MELRKNGKPIKSVKIGTGEYWSEPATVEDQFEIALEGHRITMKLKAEPKNVVEVFHPATRRRQTSPVGVIVAILALCLIAYGFYLNSTGAAGAESTNDGIIAPVQSSIITDIAPMPMQMKYTGTNTPTEIIDDVADVSVIDDTAGLASDVVEIAEAVITKSVPVYRYTYPGNLDGTYCQIPLSEDEQAYIQERCESEDRTRLVTAMIWLESSFQADIVSGTSDYGLMQINKCNHTYLTKEIGVTNFLDSYQSITAGTYIINGLMDKHNDDINLALMEYNMGPSNARKLWDRGIYSSEYSRDIIGKMEQLQLMTD